MTRHVTKSALRASTALVLKSEDDPAATVTAALAEFQTAVDGRLKAVEKAADTSALTARLDELEVKVSRPNVQTGDDKESSVEEKAFVGYVRSGRETLGAEEAKSLRVAENTAGGFLAPSQFEAQLMRELVEFSPIRQAVRVTNISAGSLVMPKRTGTLTARWVGETEERPKSEPTYGQAEIPADEIAVYVDVSNRLLEDAAIDIEAELAFDFAEEFGRLEAEAFIWGDGDKKPVGIMVDPAVPEVANGHATVLSPDSIVKLPYTLPAVYRARGSWLMNGNTIAAVRLLKDEVGRFLWQESLAEGQPPTLAGRPVIEAPEMDDVASGEYPIAYGDFGSAYRVVDRIGLSVLRDPYSVQTHGLVRFHARKRVGGGVVRPLAIRKLKMAVS